MTLDISTHKQLLIRILKEIFTDHELGPLLGFKGGTAAYFFYGLGRFSVDLDFDLLDINRVDFVFNKVEKLLKDYGTIKQAQKKRFTLFYLLSYQDKMPGAQNLKLEVNLRNFGSHYKTKQFLGITMNVMVKEDMFAHKLVAMSERIGHTNRDIFDTWYFFKNNWPLNQSIIEMRTQTDCATFIKKCIHELAHTDNRRILSGIGKLLDEENKKWVKQNLLSEVIFLLKLLLESGDIDVRNGKN